MSKRPLILVTNDDGINSPGLRAAAQAVENLGDLLIVAPSHQRTGAGRSYLNGVDQTIHTVKIPINGSEQTAYAANVTPAQAVGLALLELAPRPVSLCVSGINYGENIGSGVTISGTVGAAIEAACSHVPALAMSLETPHEYHLNHSDAVDFTAAIHFTRHFAQEILSKGLPHRVDFLKVDIPATATPQTAWRVASVSRQRYYHPVAKSQRATSSYHIYVDSDTLEPDSDIYVFSVEKQVAVVPMTIDLTAPVALPEITQFLDHNL